MNWFMFFINFNSFFLLQHVVNEMSEITNTESITSLQTLDSMTVSQMANGTARNSIITDLPIDNNMLVFS